MTARLKTARDDVVTLWENLIPPTNQSVRYRHNTALSGRGGVISPREFYFTASEREGITEFGSLYTVVKWRFNGVVRLDANKALLDMFDTDSDEKSLLASTIERYTGWTSGVRYVAIGGRATTEPTDSGDVDLVIPLVTEIEESDGS